MQFHSKTSPKISTHASLREGFATYLKFGWKDDERQPLHTSSSLQVFPARPRPRRNPWSVAGTWPVNDELHRASSNHHPSCRGSHHDHLFPKWVNSKPTPSLSNQGQTMGEHSFSLFCSSHARTLSLSSSFRLSPFLKPKPQYKQNQ